MIFGSVMYISYTMNSVLYAPVALAATESIGTPQANVTSVAAIGFGLIVTYYVTVWALVGNRRYWGDRNIRPMPPTDLAPAALRHVMRMGYDEKALAAALLSMAVKGYLYIEETDTGWAIIRDEAGDHILSSEEQVLARYIFRGRERFELSWSNRRRVASLQRRLRNALDQEYSRAYFRANTLWRVVGLVLSTWAFIFVAIALWRNGMWGEPSTSLVDFFFGAIVAIAGPAVVLREYLRSRTSSHMRYPALMTAIGGVCLVLGGSVMLDAFRAVYTAGLSPALAALAGIVFVNSVFIRLLPRYTSKGWGIVREARGFLRNLPGAKEELAETDESQRLFEVFLPYAAALDEEAAWADLFVAALDGGPKAQRESAGYAPVWYAGRRWGKQSPAEFVTEVVHGLTEAVSSSGAPTRREPGMLRAIRGRAEKLGATRSGHDSRDD